LDARSVALLLHKMALSCCASAELLLALIGALLGASDG
jgi:hypothetical protein